MFPLNAPPRTPGDITGATTNVCAGPKVYRIDQVDGATSYLWRVSAGVTIKSGQNSNSITVSFAPSFVSGSICVKAMNACGSSTEKCITLTGIPNTPAAITGPASVCAKQTNVKYEIAPVAGAKTYTWTVPDKASIISGQGTPTLYVKFATTSGNVTVKANNDCGSSAVVSRPVAVVSCAAGVSASARQGTAVVVNSQQLELDIISSAGNVSKTPTMQVDWTLGEPCIESLSSATGMYTQGFHQPIAVLTKKAIVMGAKLKIFAAPNPVSTMLKVSFEAEKEETVLLSIRDAGGRIIFKERVVTSAKGFEINMSGFSSGLYLLSAQTLSGAQSENIKIVKTN
jgi:hypothetical protein